MLGDFHLLDLLPQRSTVTGTVFAGDSDLSRAFRHSENEDEVRGGHKRINRRSTEVQEVR